MHTLCSLMMFLGRICLSAIFLWGGIGKIFQYEAMSQYMAEHGMTFIPFFLVAAAIVELLGGLSLVFGYKTRWAAAMLILFLIPVTLIFHSFWNVEDPVQMKMQMIFFLENIGLIGGLLYVLSCGPGRCAFDSSCCHKKQEEPDLDLDEE